MKRFLIVITGIFAMQLAWSSPSVAASEKDVLVIARIIDFIKDGPKKNVEVAILVNNPVSESNADSFLSLIGEGKRVRDTVLVAKKVRLDELASSTAKVVLIPDGLDAAQFADIFAVAKEKKLITISTSRDCLQAKFCALAFKSDPAVDIRMSQSAATATGVHFNPTLRMMITELP